MVSNYFLTYLLNLLRLKKIARIELSFKIEVVCVRFSFLDYFNFFESHFKSQETVNVLHLDFRNLTTHLHENFPPNLWENEKNIAIS